MTVKVQKSQQMEPQPALSGVGTVVSGEASESDEEDVNLPLNLHPSLHGIISQLVYNVSIFTTRSELRKVLFCFQRSRDRPKTEFTFSADNENENETQ